MKLILYSLILLFTCVSCAASNSKKGDFDLSPPFMVTDRTNKVHDIRALLDSGKLVLLTFWQPWCSSCKEEAPKVEALYEKHREKLSVFGVLSGPADAVDASGVERFKRLTGITYPNIRDSQVALTNRFHVRVVPTLILFQGNKVLYHGSQVSDLEPYL